MPYSAPTTYCACRPFSPGACLIAAAIASRHRILRLAAYMLLAVGICAAVAILMRGVHNPPITYFFPDSSDSYIHRRMATRHTPTAANNPYASRHSPAAAQSRTHGPATAIFYFILTAPASDAAFFIYFQF